jgi:protein involved in polysaccharide export with SLBB domain
MAGCTLFKQIAPFLFFLLFGILGCSGGRSLFPQGHQLTNNAKDMREANRPPVQIPRETEKQPLPSYAVEPGDVLLVQPVNLDSPVRLPADQPVLPDGTINLGQYGILQVMGKTVPEIEQMVRTSVEPKHKDAGFITVRLIARQSKVYYVVGEVNSPGSFQLNGRETVLDALMQAGGLTDKASRDNIILSRPTPPNCPRIVLPVCWKQIVQLGDSTTNYQIAPGDRIYVPGRNCSEMFPFLKHNNGKSPCGCGDQVPHAFPPYAGSQCPVPADNFHAVPAAPLPLTEPPGFRWTPSEPRPLKVSPTIP